MFIVELTTRQGPIREMFETYAEARRRVELFPAESLIGLAFIFQQLPDGSERLVREDGKPLQFHREIVEDTREDLDDDAPLPLAEGGDLVDAEGKLRLVERPPAGDDWQDLPLIQ